MTKPDREDTKSGWGPGLFWSGVAATGLGVVSAVLAKKAADDESERGDFDAGKRSQTWTGVMYVGFGAGAVLMVTGLVLWLTPGQDESESRYAAGVVPARGGLVFTYEGRF